MTLPPSTFRASGAWKRPTEGGVECLVCPRGCQLREGQRGACGVRSNHGGTIVLDVYGQAWGLAVDPVEKKPLYHFYPGSKVLSFGTPGCNLSCDFCQNAHLSQGNGSLAGGRQATPSELVQLARQSQCMSMAFTYNDPVVFAEYAIACAQECRVAGIKTIAVTAGYITPEARRDFFDVMDGVNVDLKSVSDDFYRKHCGARLQPVLDTLLWLRTQGKTWIEITHLVIPGRNDSPDQLEALVRWVADNLGADTPVHFSAFHPAHKAHSVQRTPSSSIVRAIEIAHAEGLRFVYAGNLPDSPNQSTRCPTCRAPLITREGYRTTVLGSLAGNQCTACGATIPGCFGAAG